LQTTLLNLNVFFSFQKCGITCGTQKRPLKIFSSLDRLVIIALSFVD